MWGAVFLDKIIETYDTTLRFATFEGSEAVSYTHLDVYKRQA